MNDVIDIRGLHKAFGSTKALDGLDLTVTAGEVHGFLGPNGAGKSTTIRVLLGLLRADAGTVRLFGGDPWRDAAELHRRLAYVPGDVNLWPTLSGGEVIDLLGRLRGGLDERRRADLIERLIECELGFLVGFEFVCVEIGIAILHAYVKELGSVRTPARVTDVVGAERFPRATA